jgi:hypothetical protein
MPSSYKDQAVPLRPLVNHASDRDRSTTNPPHEPFTGTSPKPPESELDRLSSDLHGTRLGETVYETSDSDPGEQEAGVVMTPSPSSLRSTSEFASPSYGAIASSPPDGEAAQDATTTSTSEPRGQDTAADNKVLRNRRSRRQSEEIGGIATVGGLEGRFGVTETSLSTEMLKDSKRDSDDSSEAGDVAEDDQDPPDNSPYPQVRASVAPTDNTSLSINTPRMWTLSIIFSILGSATNLFFSLRYPSVSITPVVALLLVHPLGLLWDYLLKRPDDPHEEFNDGIRSDNESDWDSGAEVPRLQRSKWDRVRLWLAQGRWNEKEHSCVYVSSNVSFGFAFATDVIVEQTQFYKQNVSITYQILLTLSTQILGYAFAGLTRRFLVRPSGMIWPGTLMSAAMFTTLHKEENKEADGWKISRWKFFFVTWISSFCFYFLPGLLMPALSYFNVITWFAPDSVVVSNLFGVVSGLGMFPITFDWAQIAYIGSPLLTPFWAAMNVIGGLVIVMWIVAPIAYYSNWLYASYMPILSAAVFDNKGNVYDVSKILTKDFLFDREAYQNYSRVFLPITYVLSYGVQFAGLASLLTHTICWHGNDIWTQWKRSLQETKEGPTPLYRPISNSNGETPVSPSAASGSRPYLTRSSSGVDNLMGREDVHNRLMRRYKDAPMSWYLATFVTMTAIGIFVVE